MLRHNYNLFETIETSIREFLAVTSLTFRCSEAKVHAERGDAWPDEGPRQVAFIEQQRNCSQSGWRICPSPRWRRARSVKNGCRGEFPPSPRQSSSMKGRRGKSGIALLPRRTSPFALLLTMMPKWCENYTKMMPKWCQHNANIMTNICKHQQKFINIPSQSHHNNIPTSS